MKSPLEVPERQIAEETSAQPEQPVAPAVIDTSKMAKGQREALELAEAARDPLEDRGSFASNLFVGRYDFDRIYPFPAQTRNVFARPRRSGRDRSHGRNSAGKFQGTRGDRRVWNQGAEEIWRTWFVAI